MEILKAIDSNWIENCSKIKLWIENRQIAFDILHGYREKKCAKSNPSIKIKLNVIWNENTVKSTASVVDSTKPMV